MTAPRLPVLLAFGGLAAVALVVLGRLCHLQVGRAALNRAAVDRQRVRHEPLPAPRGSIVDAAGRLLAYDSPVLEVRAEAYVDPAAAGDDRRWDEFAGGLSTDLAFGLLADADRPVDGAARDAQRRLLRARIERCRPAASDAERSRRRIDFLVAPELASAAVVARLEQIDRSRSDLHLYFQSGYRRTYPDREFTYGPVGFVGEQAMPDGRSLPVLRGMEAFAGLLPGRAGEREVWLDSVAHRYWTDGGAMPSPPTVLQTTLDLELQKVAHRELRQAAEAVAERYGSAPDWGAMCLCDLDDGGILAIASFRAGVHPKTAQFAPIQCLCPPGSVVKPLVFSLALERGLLDWDGDVIDCRPDGSGGWRVPGRSKPIRDSHSCGLLRPREILVQSSNIGAAKVGMRLGREGLTEFLRRYRFGQRTATLLPDERDGVCTDDLMSMPDRSFWSYSAPSLCIGYEYNITPLQLLRAYVTLLSGRERELHLFDRIALDGSVTATPRPPDGARFLSVDTLRLLREAMTGVVSDEENATARHLWQELEHRQVRPGLIAGKTGTSEYVERRRDGEGKTSATVVRTASFAGFAPSEQPRYVAVCVLQKAGAGHFWGGLYAAPAAGRLLLAALDRASPGASSPRVSAGLADGRRSGALPAVGR